MQTGGIARGAQLVDWVESRPICCRDILRRYTRVPEYGNGRQSVALRFEEAAVSDSLTIPEENLAEVGRRLREWRRFRRRTQREVAAAIGITQASLSNYERGLRDANVSTVPRLATVLSVSPGDLLSSLPPNVARVPPRLRPRPNQRTYTGPQLIAVLNTLVEHLNDEDRAPHEDVAVEVQPIAPPYEGADRRPYLRDINASSR